MVEVSPEQMKTLVDTLRRMTEMMQQMNVVINTQVENTRKVNALLGMREDRVVRAIEDSTSAPWLPGPLMQVYSDLGNIRKELGEIRGLLSRQR